MGSWLTKIARLQMQFISSQLLEKLTIKTDEKVRLQWHRMLLTGDGMMPPIDLSMHELEAEATDLFQRLIKPGGGRLCWCACRFLNRACREGRGAHQ
jgi:hypothetical protein